LLANAITPTGNPFSTTNRQLITEDTLAFDQTIKQGLSVNNLNHPDTINHFFSKDFNPQLANLP
jgi:hypothetical protein